MSNDEPIWTSDPMWDFDYSELIPNNQEEEKEDDYYDIEEKLYFKIYDRYDHIYDGWYRGEDVEREKDELDNECMYSDSDYD